MISNRLFSIATALILGGTMLHADPPDRNYGNDGKYSQKQDRSAYNRDNGPSKGELRREEVQPDRGQRVGTPPAANRQQNSQRPGTDYRREINPPKQPVPGKSVSSQPSKEYRREINPPQPPVVKRPAPSQPDRDYRGDYRPPHDNAVYDRDRYHRHYYRPPGVKPLPYYYRPGYVTRSLPRVAITISLGGLLFYYADGIYYRHATSGFIVALPPVGLVVTSLPVGYTVFLYGGITYYYYADVYYVWDGYRSGYRVVEAPLDTGAYRPGDVVDFLPDGAYSVTINGRQYYRYYDLYFMQVIQDNRIIYIVVNP